MERIPIAILSQSHDNRRPLSPSFAGSPNFSQTLNLPHQQPGLSVMKKVQFSLKPELANLQRKRAVPQRRAQPLSDGLLSNIPTTDESSSPPTVPLSSKDFEFFNYLQQQADLMDSEINRSFEEPIIRKRKAQVQPPTQPFGRHSTELNKEPLLKNLSKILQKHSTVHPSPSRCSLNSNLSKRLMSPPLHPLSKTPQLSLPSSPKSREIKLPQLPRDVLNIRVLKQQFNLPTRNGRLLESPLQIKSQKSAHPSNTDSRKNKALSPQHPPLNRTFAQPSAPSQLKMFLQVPSGAKGESFTSPTPVIQTPSSDHLASNSEHEQVRGTFTKSISIEDSSTLREKYEQALQKSRELAVNANKFKSQPFLLLFSIKERDEKPRMATSLTRNPQPVKRRSDNLESLVQKRERFYSPQLQEPLSGESTAANSDEATRDKYVIIGQVDDKMRKKVMTSCYKRIREMMIGPTTSHYSPPEVDPATQIVPVFNVTKSTFFISNIKTNAVLNEFAFEKLRTGDSEWIDSLVDEMVLRLGNK